MAMDGVRRFGNSIPVAGSLLSSIWGDPDQEAHSKAMEEAAKQYEQYRPLVADARFKAMENMSSAFGPMQQLMGQMYGPGAQMDFSKIVQQPKLMPNPEDKKAADKAEAQKAMDRAAAEMKGRFF